MVLEEAVHFLDELSILPAKIAVRGSNVVPSSELSGH